MNGQPTKTLGQSAAAIGARLWMLLLNMPRWPQAVARMCSPHGRVLLFWRLRTKPLTWDNLKDVKFDAGDGIANLQEYWRLGAPGQPLRDPASMADELVTDVRGRVWHIAHVPPWVALKGARSKARWTEAQWQALEAIIQARVDAGSFTPTTVDAAPLRTENRARLDGCHLRTLPKPSAGDLHLACPSALFSKVVKLSDVTFGSTPNFFNAFFKRGGNFNKSRFSKGAHFRDTVFGQKAEFQEAQFSGRADFQGIVVCWMALFGSRSEAAEKTTFSDVAKFNGARFFNGANFSDLEFKDKSAFDGSLFARRCDFLRTTFSGPAIFEGARFYRRANFAFAKFKRSVTFAGARFDGLSDFEDSELPGDLSFDRAKFTAIERMLFFTRLWFALALAFALWTYFGAPWSAGLVHKAWLFVVPVVCLAASWLIPKDSQLAARLWFLLATAFVVWAYLGAPLPDQFETYRGLVFALPLAVCLAASSYMAKDTKVEPFERSYSYLAAQADQAGNRKDAAHFLRKHQRAKRLRWRHSLPGRFLSILYDVVASYGDSLRRPTLWLLVSVLAFAAIFWTWANGGPTNATEWMARLQRTDERAAIVSAMEFSLTNILQPFATWTPPPPGGQECNFRTNLLVTGLRKTASGTERCHPSWLAANGDLDGHRFAVRVVSALQSVVSGLLLFLMALAARRRFSIS